MIGSYKLVIKLQTVPGGVLCISFVVWLTSILGLLQIYHDSDRLNFNCDPKPSDFIRQLCYNNYISAITKPHGLIPRDVVGITLLIVCGVYIIFAIYGNVTLRKRPGYRNENTNTFLCGYFIQVGFRMLFLVFMSRLVYSYEKIVLPDFFECDVNQTNSQTTPSPLKQTKITLTCHDLHHEEKSKINKAFIVGNVLFMVCSIFEVLHLWCKRETCLQYLIGDLEGFRTDDSPQTVSAYTSALKSSIMYRTEFQPKLIASRTISNVKTDEIFTNLLMQDGRIDLIGDDETCYSRRAVLERYGKVSGTQVNHCSEIFLGAIDDQESTNSILVVGKAGIGKSLFCQKVIRDWASNELFQPRENTEIPNLKFVYLLTFRQLNLFKNNCVTLRGILNCPSVLDDKCDINDSTFKYILEHPEQLMIVLDGYDEYLQQDYIVGNLEEQHPNDVRRKMPVAALCSKLIKGKILRGAMVMITSRPDESDKMGGIRFKRYVEIAGFSKEQVKEYIEKYFKNNENMKNAVLKHVMNNENLVSFAHIPMLCYLLCFEMEYTLTVFKNPDDLPVSTTDIYIKLIYIFQLKHCTESEYRQKEIPEQLKPPPVIKITLDNLSKLAAKLLRERKPTFEESEMGGDFKTEEVNKLKGSGLLYCGQPFRIASTTTTKYFSFTHLTIQEFLAARWFVKENCVPDEECSEMVFQFMAGVLSNEGKEELMEKLLDSPLMHRNLKMTCLNEYQNKEFAKKFIRNNPQAFCNSDGVMAFEDLSDLDCIGASFVLDIISELNEEEAGEAQHKCSDKFVTVKELELSESQLTLSGIQRVCNSLNNEHCLVSELNLVYIYLTDECVHVINRLVVRKLTTLSLAATGITDTSVAGLCEALQHPSCKLTTLNLEHSGITDTGVASLCEALQHPSCKLTTLNLQGSIHITDTGIASLCEALQHSSCKLTTLNLRGSYVNDIGVASLCEALQHPSCKLTTLNLRGSDITDIGVASLCEALQHPSSKLTRLDLPSFLSPENREILKAITQRHRPALNLSFEGPLNST